MNIAAGVVLLLGCQSLGTAENATGSGDERGATPSVPTSVGGGQTGGRGGALDPLPETACSAFDDEYDFVEISACAGLDAIHVITDFDYYAIGQAWGDYDRDGWVDLYVTDMEGPNSLYRNRGDGTFELVWQDQDEVESAGAVFVDYDNDGWPDLFVLNRGRNVLYRNESGEGFVDVTARAGLGDRYQGSSAAWADFDGDGWLDLYVVNWLHRGTHEHSEDVFYHSNGDGTFENITGILDPAAVSGAGFAVSFVDYDGDGDLDLYVVNDKGYEGPARGAVTNRNVLFRNDGPGCTPAPPEDAEVPGFGWCFTEVGEAAGADLRLDGMGLATGDYDNDGDLDFYVTDSPLSSVLLRNRGDGTFVDVTELAGAWGSVETAGSEWGTVFLDYDNDGWLDLYVASEGTSSLLRNLGDGTFDDVTEASGAGDPLRSLGVASADYDRDGNVDLVIGERGWGYHLYRNTGRAGAGRHWLTVRLVGGGPVNRDAIGARVTLRTTDGRTMLREVKCGSSLGAGNDTASHFGLGEAGASEIEIRWPDGTVELRTEIPIDTEVTYRYGG